MTRRNYKRDGILFCIHEKQIDLKPNRFHGGDKSKQEYKEFSNGFKHTLVNVRFTHLQNVFGLDYPSKYLKAISLG